MTEGYVHAVDPRASRIGITIGRALRWRQVHPATEPNSCLYVINAVLGVVKEIGHVRGGDMNSLILGVSGSPVPNSNTDRLVKCVLENAGQKSEFVKLSQLEIRPCRACLACAKTNICTGIEDDWRVLAPKVVEAKALVIGGWMPFGILDSRTKAFLERTFSLRHSILLNGGKVGAAIVTGTVNPDPVADDIAEYFKGEGIRPMGKIVASGIDPCWSCGLGDECVQGTPYPMVRSGYRPWRYPYADRLPSADEFRITPDIVPPGVMNQDGVIEDARKLGKLISTTLKRDEEARTVLLENLLSGITSKNSIELLLALTEKSHLFGWISNEHEPAKLLSSLKRAEAHRERDENTEAVRELLTFGRDVLYRTGISIREDGSSLLVQEARKAIADLYDVASST